MVSMARVFDVRISNSYQHDENFRCPDTEQWSAWREYSMSGYRTVISMTRVFDVRISNSYQHDESF